MVASVHSRLDQKPAAMTVRLIRAIRNPLVDVRRTNRSHRDLNQRHRERAGVSRLASRRAYHYGILGIEGILLAPGIFEGRPLVALLTAHEAKMSVACCATYPCSILVALGSGSFVLLANVEAAAEITDGLLKTEGAAAAGFGT